MKVKRQLSVGFIGTIMSVHCHVVDGDFFVTADYRLQRPQGLARQTVLTLRLFW